MSKEHWTRQYVERVREAEDRASNWESQALRLGAKVMELTADNVDLKREISRLNGNNSK